MARFEDGKLDQPLTPAQVETAEQQAGQEGYIKRELIAVDVFANTTLGGLPGETISSRAERWEHEKTGIKHAIGEVVSDGLDLLQKQHGRQAEAGDLERGKQLIATEQQAIAEDK